VCVPFFSLLCPSLCPSFSMMKYIELFTAW
jgi:hypothetical protein